MHKVIATGFDAETWDKHGLTWSRAVKSIGCLGLVVDNGLTDQARAKLAELRFRVVPQSDAKIGPFAVLAKNLKEGEKCLWCSADCDFKSGSLDSLFAAAGLACAGDGSPLHNIVLPVANIRRRAEAACLIEEKVVPVSGSPLTAKLVCGDSEAWAGFVGYYEFLVHSAYLEARLEAENVALNLYAANFPGRVTIV